MNEDYFNGIIIDVSTIEAWKRFCEAADRCIENYKALMYDEMQTNND